VNTPTDRLPPIPAEQMTSVQRQVAEELAAGRRGAVYGPFVPLLRSPELTRRLQKVGEYLRYEPRLPPKLREMAILLVAREWTQDFEWAVHAPLAASEGLGRDVIDAIAEGRRPAAPRDDEALVHDFFFELARSRSISDATYGRAVEAFGEHGVIDLVALIGYYATLAMIMNVARTPLPEGRTATLRPLPRG
jgi:4-carboxymuconolactone decarboxylase